MPTETRTRDGRVMASPPVVPIPNLIEVQIDSFQWFLEEGLRELFRNFSPIKDFADNLTLELVDYYLEQPEASQDECRQRDITYEAPIKVKIRLWQREAEVKEAEVYMGKLPLMTQNGTFIINGAERVVVSQLARSPGVYFRDNIDYSGRTLYYATVIPSEGAWTEVETETTDAIKVRVGQTKRFPITTLLRAMGALPEATARSVENVKWSEAADRQIAIIVRDPQNREVLVKKGETLNTDSIRRARKILGGKTVRVFRNDPPVLIPASESAGFHAAEDYQVITRDGLEHAAVKAGEKITPELALKLETWAENAPLNSAVGRVLASDWGDKPASDVISVADAKGRVLNEDAVDKNTGEVLFEAGHKLTAPNITKLSKAGITDISVQSSASAGLYVPAGTVLTEEICKDILAAASAARPTEVTIEVPGLPYSTLQIDSDGLVGRVLYLDAVNAETQEVVLAAGIKIKNRDVEKLRSGGVLEVTVKEDIKDPDRLKGRILAEAIVAPGTGEVLYESGYKIKSDDIGRLQAEKVPSVRVTETTELSPADVRVPVEPLETIKVRNRLITNEEIFQAFGSRIELHDPAIEDLLPDDHTDIVPIKDVIGANHKVIAPAYKPIDQKSASEIVAAGITHVVALKVSRFISVTLKEDPAADDEAALMDIYRKIRPGDPATHGSAQNLLHSVFYDPRRYDLARVGRYKLNRKLKQSVDPDATSLTQNDIVQIIRYIIQLSIEASLKDDEEDKRTVRVDDIDHLENKRVRSVGELLQNQLRLGFLRMEKVARERMSSTEPDQAIPQVILSVKPISASIKSFFGSSQLSQFMDQHNPLAELTHKRRLSALGPGGLSRQSAKLEVRDVHHSHYGRICPIETPEGPNIGLIGSMAVYTRINEFGFLESPYYRVKDGKITIWKNRDPEEDDSIEYLTADTEEGKRIAPSSARYIILEDDDEKTVIGFDGDVQVRDKGRFPTVPPDQVDYMDISPMQVFSPATSLIPFLENDDANRALMGSNMQRQAVPVIKTDAPLVGTGLESRVAMDSGAVIISPYFARVKSVTSQFITLTELRTDRRSAPLMEDRPLSEAEDYILGAPIYDVHSGEMLATTGTRLARQRLHEVRRMASQQETVPLAQAVNRRLAEDTEGLGLRHAVIPPSFLNSNGAPCSIPVEIATHHVLAEDLLDTEGRIVAQKGERVTTDMVFDEHHLGGSIEVGGDYHWIWREGDELEHHEPGSVIVHTRKPGLPEMVLVEGPASPPAEVTVFRHTIPRLVTVLSEHTAKLETMRRSNQATCIRQVPIVQNGQKVDAGQPLADGPCTDHGQLALGQNLLVAFMPWCGYNYEDAIILSERMVKDDVFTSIHIEKYEVEARDTKLGPEEITRDIPNVSDDTLADLDEFGIIRIGAEVGPEDILVGKVAPKSQGEQSAEERLIIAIFGKKAEETRDVSLRVPHGEKGKIIDVKVFSRYKYKCRKCNAVIDYSKKPERNACDHCGGDLDRIQGDELPAGVNELVRVYIAQKRKIMEGDKMAGRHGNKGVVSKILPVEEMPFLPDGTPVDIVLNPLGVPSRMNIGQVMETHLGFVGRVLGRSYEEHIFAGDKEEDILREIGQLVDHFRSRRLCEYIGTELDLPLTTTIADSPGAILNETRALISALSAEERKSLADKIAVCPVRPAADWLEADKKSTTFNLTPELVAEDESNPDADKLIERIEANVYKRVGLNPATGKCRLISGQTGEPYDTESMIGQIYMMKLLHLVEDKIHARSTGPYSLVTQQPLGGKAQFGGQRFGEMEVWALEAYGAASTLQEILTIKSDDVLGRVKTYESIVKGDQILEPGVPESFKILVNELQSLCLKISVEDENGREIDLRLQEDEQYESAERAGAPRFAQSRYDG